MAKEQRDLDVSSLSATDILRASPDMLRRIKPVSAAKFSSLSKNIQMALELLYDQAFAIWCDIGERESLEKSELFDILEGYKTRKFATFPEPLQADILEIAKEPNLSDANEKFLLWILEKQNYGELPEQLKDFYDHEFEKIANSAEGTEKPVKKAYVEYLLPHLMQFEILELTQNQRIFVNKAFKVNIDRINNDRLACLVAFAKQIDSDEKYEKAPQNLKEFLFEAYKRCVAKTETAANNRRLQSGWKMAADKDYNECFADFNRAFAGVKKYDSTDLNEPTKKLTLENLIAYANLQHEFLNIGSFVFDMPTYETTKQCAENLGLEKIAEEIDGVQRYVPGAIIPREKVVETTSSGYAREKIVDSKRKYKTSVASPLAKAFEIMLKSKVEELSHDIDFVQPNSKQVDNNIYSVFKKDLPTSCNIILELVAVSNSTSKEAYENKLLKTLGDFVNVEELIKVQDNIYVDEIEYEQHDESEKDVLPRTRMDQIVERLKDDSLSDAERSDLQDEYMNLERQIYE